MTSLNNLPAYVLLPLPVALQTNDLDPIAPQFLTLTSRTSNKHKLLCGKYDAISRVSYLFVYSTTDRRGDIEADPSGPPLKRQRLDDEVAMTDSLSKGGFKFLELSGGKSFSCGRLTNR